MLYDLVQKAAPTSVTGLSKPKANRISYTEVTDERLDFYVIYKYASSSDAASHINILETIVTYETIYSDHSNMTAGVAYWYRVSYYDTDVNESLKSTAISVTYQAILDTDTSQDDPNVPTVALASYTGDYDNDGDIDTGLTITATPGTVDATHPKAVSYVVQLWKSATSGGTYVFHKRYPMPETVLEVEVPQKWFYKAIIKAVGWNGVASAFSTLPVGATGVQPAQYLGSIPTPAAPTITPVANGMAISWPDPSIAAPTYKTHKETIVFVGGVEVWRGAGTKFTDTTARTVDTSYTYTLQNVDKQGRVGTVSSGTAAVYRAVRDTDTSQDDPNPPSVSLASYTGDADNDGDIDTGLTITVTPGAVDATHPKAVSYIVQLWKSTSSGGSYSFFKRYPMPETVLEVAVPQKWFYKAAVRAVSFNGIVSTLTTLPVGATGIQPAQYLGSIPTPAAPSVTPVANGMQIAWTAPAYSTHKETIVFADGVEVWRGAGTRYIDVTLRSIGTSYTYTLQNVDKQNRVGSVSSGAAAVYRGLSGNESNTLDVSVMAENNDLSLGPNIGWSNSTLIVSDPTNAYKGEYVIKRAYTGAASSTTNRNKYLFPVRAGEVYYIGGMLKTDASWAGSSYYYRISFCTDATGATEVATANGPINTTVNTSWFETGGFVTVPTTSTIAYARIEFVTLNQTAGTVFGSHCYCRAETSKSVMPGGILQTQADQSAPSIPTVSLASYTGDIDADGDVDTGLTITVTPGVVDATYPKAVGYIVQLWKSTTSGGTYTLHRRVPMSETVTEVKTAQKYFYKAIVKAISFSGVVSTFSTLPSGTTGEVQPAKYLGSIPTPSAPSVTPIANGMLIAWADPIIATPAFTNHKETIVFVGGVEIWRGKGTKFTDTTIRTVGTSYTYTLQNVDTQSRVGSVSSGTAIAYRAASSVEIGVGAVTASNIGPDAVTSVSLSSFDTSNMVRDPQCLHPSLWATNSGIIASTATGLISASTNRLTSTANTATVWISSLDTDIAVEVGRAYYASAFIDMNTGTANMRFMIQWFSMDISGVTTLIATDTLFNGSVSSWLAVSGVAVAPANARRAKILVQKDATATALDFTFHSPTFRKATDSTTLTTGYGSNQFENADFVAGTTGWGMRASNLPANFALSLRTDTYGVGYGSLQVYQNNGTTAVYYDACQYNHLGVRHFPITPAKTYEASVYYLGHRYDSVVLYLQWLDKDKGHLSFSNLDSATTPRDSNPVSLLSNYGRMWGKAVAPTGAAYCIPFFRHGGTLSGQADSYVWWNRPLFGECNPNQLEASPWVPGPLTIVSSGYTDPTPPPVPSVSLASYTGDADNDGTVDTGLTVTVTPGTATTVDPVSYIVQLWRCDTIGGTYVFHKRYPMPETVREIEVPQRYFYKAIVKAVSFSGAVSAFSTLPGGSTGVQPAKYLGTIPTPSAPAVTPIAGGMLIAWPDPKIATPAYTAHKETIVFVGGVEVWRGAGTKFTDPTIRTAGTSYTYTLQNVDVQDRVGTVSSGTAATYRLIAATDTTQTALAVPGNIPVLTQTSQDIDGDGSTDIAISVTYTTVAGATSHELEISTCTTVGGTYVVQEIIPATVSLSKEFAALTTLYYKVRSRGVGFNGVAGGWSNPSTALKPVKPANTVPTVGTPTVVAFAGFNRVTAPTVAISNLKRYNVYSYIGTTTTPGSAVLVGSITAGNPFDDARTLLVDGNTCWYYLTAVDSWDNESAAKSTGASTVYRIVEPGDVSSDAIIPSKVFPRDFTKLNRDSEMIELANYTFTNAPTTARIVNTTMGPSRFAISMTRTGSAVDTYMYGTKDTPVEEFTRYLFSGYVNIPASTVALIYVEWYNVDVSGIPSNLISTSAGIAVASAAGISSFDEVFVAPAAAQAARLVIEFTGGTTTSNFRVASLCFRRMIHSHDYVDRSIDNNKLNGLPLNYLSGFELSNYGPDPVNDIEVEVGECASSAGDRIVLATSLVKRLDAAWAAGDNGGGLDTGTIANAVYHVFAIRNPTTGVSDIIFSTGVTAPTVMPSGYTQSRRIGSIIRVGGTILPFSQKGDEFLLVTGILDVNVTTLGTSETSQLLTVPTGIKVNALVRINGSNASSWAVAVSSYDEANLPPSFAGGVVDIGGGAGVASATPKQVRTTTAGLVRSRSSAASTTLRILTYGWIDTRGKG